MNKRSTPHLLAVLALALGLAAGAFAQDRGGNASNRMYRASVNPHWFAGNNKFWYRDRLADDKSEFILVDAAQGTRAPAFDHQRLAQALSQKTGDTVKGDQLPFTDILFADDGKSVEFSGKDDVVWSCDLASYALTETKGVKINVTETSDILGGGRRGGGRRGAAGPPPRPPGTSPSPDGKLEAFIHGSDLWLRDIETKKETQLSYGGNPGDTYLRDVERERAVGMTFDAPDPLPTTPDVTWSPDSKHLVAISTRPVPIRLVYYVESSPKDQVQPKLHSYPYMKPGDEIPLQVPHLFDVVARKEIPVSNTLFPNPWSLEEFRWVPDSSRFMFLFNQRGHQNMRIISVDARTGEAKPIVDEHSDTFIDYSGMFYSDYLTNSDEIIWMSERDGWNHLYLYDAKTGKAKNQITKGEWVVRGVDSVDAGKRQIFFRAGGIRPGQDPYYIHYCRVNFDGSGLTILTEGNGTHTIAWAPSLDSSSGNDGQGRGRRGGGGGRPVDRRYFIDTYSRVDMPPVNELRSGADGKLICKLEESDISAILATGWRPPEPFVSKARDGVTDIYGIIARPTNFDPQKKYPVVENIYAGPQGSFVPKPFSPPGRGQTLIDLGFIQVQIDGLGTANRSRKFHDVCWKNIVDAGFPDRILWMKAAAAKYPSLDLTRVGIYGTSAGGQDALAALLTHGDFYKVGVADSGCHDNRMDKIWWNEQWMGWPVGPEYVDTSNVTLAHQLQGKLLLMVGEADENVDPATSMQVVNALIKADKDFDLLVMPGQGHGVAGTPYGQRRLRDFFVRNLLGTEPKMEAHAVTAPGASQ